MGAPSFLPKTHMPNLRMDVEEYLHTSFDGADREFLDGEVVERNMGNKSHGKIQAKLIVFFANLSDRTGLFVIPELRHRVTRTRYRIPDVAVFEGEPAEEVPSSPPLIAIEILSPEDRIAKLIPKLEEYRRWGVAHIWIIDPDARKFFIFTDGIQGVESLEVQAYDITLRKSDLLSA